MGHRPAEIPEAWYAVAASSAVGPRLAVPFELAGRSFVAWRPEGGAPRAHAAFCPHLGAHLGHGGYIDGCTLVCPFHGFRFGPDGACVGSGYGTPAPPGAALAEVPIRERHGLLFAWHGAGAPSFEVPFPDLTGWSAFVIHRWTLTGHPQEVTENSVDIGHFSWVHGYRQIDVESAVVTEGPSLRGAYGFTRPILGRWSTRQHITLAAHGLGYSEVEVRVDGVPLGIRLLVLPTPLGGDRLELRVGVALKGWRALHRLMLPILLRVYVHEVEQDFRIWANKAYVDRPMLAKGDGPVGRYRRWVRQFYPSVDRRAELPVVSTG